MSGFLQAHIEIVTDGGAAEAMAFQANEMRHSSTPAQGNQVAENAAPKRQRRTSHIDEKI